MKINWKTIEELYLSGKLEISRKKPAWLNDDFINEYAEDIEDEDEEFEDISEEEQLDSFYSPLFKVAKTKTKDLTPEVFYVWMQEVLE